MDAPIHSTHANAPTWKDRLEGKIAPEMAREIASFEAQMLLRKQGKIEERVFAETRLRRGTYGQRYDNGRRHDGAKTQDLNYPLSPLTTTLNYGTNWNKQSKP